MNKKFKWTNKILEDASICPHCNCFTYTIKGFCGKCKKYKLIKIRRKWKRNPNTQVIPNKKKLSRQKIKQEIKKIIDEY